MEGLNNPIKEFLKNFYKRGDGSIRMTFHGGVGLLIFPDGKILTYKEGDENDNIIYSSSEDYPVKPAYKGQIDRRTYQPEGMGELTYYNQHMSSYVGYFRDGIPGGNGITTYRNGMTENGFIDGSTFTGTQTHNCGTTVQGVWDKGVVVEVTKVTFSDGRFIVETKPHESDDRYFVGRIFFPGQGAFVGDIWKTSFTPHNGTMTFMDGRLYTGGCCHGGQLGNRFCANGSGKMVLADGTTYTGKWDRDFVCNDFRGTLRLFGENDGEIVGHPHVGVMAKFFKLYDFTANCGAQEELVEQEACESDADEELVQRKLARASTVASDNEPDNLKSAVGACKEE